MKFAKVVFWTAGAVGIVLLAPLFFIFDQVGRQNPPPITHPQFYYGFAGLGLVWQIAFFLIATDPRRFRPMMLPAILEKLSYVAALLLLYLEERITPVEAATGVPDALLLVLFIAAYQKTGRALSRAGSG